MTMEEALLTRLLGGPAGERVDWFDRPTGGTALTLTKVDPGREWTHDGPDRLDEPRIRFECWGESKDATAGLSRWLRGEMEQQRTIQVTGGTMRFYPAALELERWDKPDRSSGAAVLFRVTMDFTFHCEWVGPTFFSEEITP